MFKGGKTLTCILFNQMPRNVCRQLGDCCLRGRAVEAHCGVAGSFRWGGGKYIKGVFSPPSKSTSYQKKNSRVSAVVDVVPVGWGFGCGFGFTGQLKHLFDSKSSHK